MFVKEIKLIVTAKKFVSNVENNTVKQSSVTNIFESSIILYVSCFRKHTLIIWISWELSVPLVEEGPNSLKD